MLCMFFPILHYLSIPSLQLIIFTVSCNTADKQQPPLNFLKGIKLMDFLKDLWGFLRERKKFWLLPIILFMLLFGVLIVLTGGSAIAPFIYAIF